MTYKVMLIVSYKLLFLTNLNFLAILKKMYYLIDISFSLYLNEIKGGFKWS